MPTQLTRTVRFCLRADGTLDESALAHNTFAGWPPMRGFGRYYELHLTCAGEVDPVTGYMVNIKQIDQAARAVALPLVSRYAQHDGDNAELGAMLAELLRAMNEELPVSLRQVVFQMTPTCAYAMEHDDMNHVLISQRFDFSAAHRLHVSALSDAENRKVFGKCNNPSGHGHNYRVEVAVRCPLGEGSGVMPVEQLDAVVDRTIIQYLDHKHLNVDVPEFAKLNPSVEHIARVIYERLKDTVKSLTIELDHVSVWETDKTVCTYRG